MSTVFVGAQLAADTPLSSSIGVWGSTFANDLASLAEMIAEFIEQWCTRLPTSAAYVSHRADDTLTVTEHERAAGGLPLSKWSETQRFARGAFWAMFLGPALCHALGGAEYVLRSAPVADARRVSDGVWLQLSKMAPADDEAHGRLEHFLRPLLQWTANDVRGERRADASVISVSSEKPRIREERPAERSVPVSRLPEFARVSTALNIRVDTAPTGRIQLELMAMLRSWQEASMSGRFGGHGIHDIGRPSVDGNVVRWEVDFGDTDSSLAVAALAADLAEIRGFAVLSIVVGMEPAG